MKKIQFVAFAVLALVTAVTQAQTTYFLVAKADPKLRTDSYILPLTNGLNIAHARALIEYGPDAGNPLVVANIACCPDGINHDYLSPNKHCWNWHITEFLGFASATTEILDGNPTFLNYSCLKTGIVQSTIGFWSYTVVAELGTDIATLNCRYDINNDTLVQLADFAILASRWLEDGCVSPSWCSWSDLNHDGSVNDIDLQLLAGVWLSPHTHCPIWFEAWNCTTQCHGDVDCATEGSIIKYSVYQHDLNIFITQTWGYLSIYYGTEHYDPRLDFDRDYDIDEDDGTILETWLGKKNVPADCPTQP